MVLYFLVLIYWLLLFEYGKDKKNNNSIFFAILPLVLIMALKSVSVGSDTISYYNRYVGALDMLTAANAITEPGYNIVSYFFHDVIGAPFWVFNAIVSIFVCFILGSFLKHFSSNTYLSLYLYMTIGMFTMSMSGLRQVIAVSICTIPVIWSKICEDRGKEKRSHKFWRMLIGVGLVLLAFTFHNSAIIFLPILFLMDIRLSRRQTILLMTMAITTLLFRSIIVGFMGNFVFDKYDKYDLEEGYMMNILALLVPIAIGLFCVIISRPNCGERAYSKAMSTMFIFLALQVTFNNLSLSQNQIGRLGFYYMNSYIILIPFALKKISVNTRSFVTLAIIVLCLIYFYLGTDDGTLRIDNYKFFWQEPIYLKN